MYSIIYLHNSKNCTYCTTNDLVTNLTIQLFTSYVRRTIKIGKKNTLLVLAN